MHPTVTQILAEIESLRALRLMNNDAARLASFAVTTLNEPGHEDDAILANRLIVQGADPLSILLIAINSVEQEPDFPTEVVAVQPLIEAIRTAHRSGPGELEGEARDFWLMLAGYSDDEAKSENSVTHSVIQRVGRFLKSVATFLGSSDREMKRMVESMRSKIMGLPYKVEAPVWLKTTELGGTPSIRIYDADLGFAAAYWSGEKKAAVRSEDGETIVVGTVKSTSLAEQGIQAHKELSPTFGLVFTNQL